MKKRISLLLMGCMVCAASAFAATPAAPVFNAAVKVAEGKLRGQGNRIAVDGTTLYAAFEDASNGQFRVAKSTNGVTWGLSMAPDPAAVDAREVRVAVSNDPVYAGLKIVHTVWNAYGTSDLMYSYFSTRPNQVGWSSPVRINGSAIDYNRVYLVASKTGAAHVLLGNYYTTASSPDSAFSEPIAIAASGSQGSLAIDAQNNLYAAFNNGTFVRKPSGSSWSAPVSYIGTGTIINDGVDIAVANATTCYIAYGDLNTSKVVLAVSTNSGSSWTRRNAMSFTADAGPNPAIAVTSTKILTLVSNVARTASGGNVNKVVRTSDNGVTWSSAVTVQGDDSEPTIALDSNNKAMIYSRDGQDGVDWSFIRTNPNANLIFVKEK